MTENNNEEGRRQQRLQRENNSLASPPPYSEGETSVLPALSCADIGSSGDIFNRHFEELGTDDEDIEMDRMHVGHLPILKIETFFLELILHRQKN
mgnify:CR=1 FL=1